MPTNPGLQPFGYKGAFSDPVAEGAGLVWMGVRAYTPKLARFTTPDPEGLAAGWNEHDPLAGDPVNLSDTDGRQATSTQPVPVPGFWPFPSAQELEDFGHAVNEVGNQIKNLFDPPVGTLDPMAGSLANVIQVCIDQIDGDDPSPQPTDAPNFDDPTVPPGEGWEWRGKGDKGSWYNPQTGESLHPDLEHPDPIGPHYDWRAPDKSDWRVYPDGTVQPK